MNGAIYILTQDPRYIDLVRVSAGGLKRAMPDLAITVFSEFPLDGPFDKVVLVEGEKQTQLTPRAGTYGTLRTSDGFYDKARLMLESPYERTVFLDADIHVAQPFPELFTLLDRFDCAANHEEYINTDWFNRYPRPDIPTSFPEFNTGVLAYKRSPAMDAVLRRWCELYKTHRQRNPQAEVNDQPFFREAVYYGDVRMATLTREYNCKFRGQGYLNGPVKLLHGHMNFQVRPQYMHRVTAVMNGCEGPRVYIANRVYAHKLVGRLVGRRTAQRVGSFPDSDSILVQRARRLSRLVREQGMGAILKKLVPKGFSRRSQPALMSDAPQN